MQSTQINFLTEDRFKLYGLSYGSTTNSTLAIFIHGAGDSSVFRKGELLGALSSELTKSDIDVMAFNNRGSGYVSSIKRYNKSSQVTEKRMAGMAYERIADCVTDIDAAIDWALENNYRDIILIGHSTGANKVVLYLTAKSKHLSNVKQAFLLGGGDDITLQNSRIQKPSQYLKDVKSKVGKGDGNKLVAERDFPGEHPISHASLLELIEENSDYDIFPFGRHEEGNNNFFARFKQVKHPTVAIYGSEDYGTVIPVSDALKLLESNNPNVTTSTIAGADHSFTNMDEQLAREIASKVI